MIPLIKTAFKAATTITAIAVVTACTSPKRLPAAHVDVVPNVRLEPASLPGSIKVVSLNAAHSRSMGVHQMLQSADTARENLDAMVTMLERENPHIVALQEVDGPSVWSGKFDHVRYLAERAGYSHTVRGTHLKAPGLDYGTALMAQYPMNDAVSVGFDRALTVTQKGFVISSFQWPGSLTMEVDLVSLHLDPIRPKIRERQVTQLAEVMRERGRPAIVMGDFNCDWYDEDTAVRVLGEALGLNPHSAQCEECYTHRRMNRFVDWILVSPELSFESFQILDDDISDHYAIAATIYLNDTASRVHATAP